MRAAGLMLPVQELTAVFLGMFGRKNTREMDLTTPNMEKIVEEIEEKP